MATNWALASNGASIFTTDNYAGYPNSRLIDGNATPEWYSVGAPSVGSPHIQEITFAAAKRVNLFEAVGLASYKNKDWTLEYWNLNTLAWVNLDTVTNNAATDYSKSFTAVVTTKIRLKVTAVHNGYVCWQELRVWGDDAVAISSSSPITPAVVGDAASGSFAATGGSGTGTWSKASGTYPTGLSVASNGARSGTLSAVGTFNFRMRFEDSANTANAIEKDFVWVINDVPPAEPFYNGFELLQIIPCLSAKPSISFQKFKHSLGDGHRKTALYGSNTGLKKWSLTYKTLANFLDTEKYLINGVELSPAEYLWDFYCRWQVSGQPFIMTCPRNGQYYLADFLDEELSFERLAVQLWTTGLQITQVRSNNDFVFKPTLFGDVLEYKADDLSLSDNATVSSWAEANGGASLTVSGGATFQTNEQFGLPIVRLDGTDDFISLSGANTIYHVFILLKITEATFGGNDGLFGDASTDIVSGVSGQAVFNTGDDAPVNQYGIVWFTIEGGQALTNIQIGKKQAVSGTFLKADIAHIVLAKEQKSQTECLEMVEYIATKWNCFKVFKVNL